MMPKAAEKVTEEYTESVLTGDPNAKAPVEVPDDEDEDSTDFEALIADEDFEDEEDAPLGDEDTPDKKVAEVVEDSEGDDDDKDTVVEDKPQVEDTTTKEVVDDKEGELSQQPVVPSTEPQQPEAAPSATPEELNAQYEKFFNDSVEVLAEKVYKFDEETAEKLDTNPSEVMPRLAAQLHMQVLTAAVTQVANLLPQAMALQSERQTTATERETDFFGKFPDLKGHKDTVQRLAAAYRQAHPNAAYEQARDEIGTMAMVALRKPLPGTQQSEPPVPKPVTPTSGKGGATPPAAHPEPTVWDELIAEED